MTLVLTWCCQVYFSEGEKKITHTKQTFTLQMQ